MIKEVLEKYKERIPVRVLAELLADIDEAEAKQEASRCLRCDHFGYGIFKGGRETLW